MIIDFVFKLLFRFGWMNYSILFKKLFEHDVRYVICGGLAVNLHGIPRMTADIDLILDLTKENLNTFNTCVDELKYKIAIPFNLTEAADETNRKKLKEEKNLVAISYYNYDSSFMALDVLIDFPIPFEKLWKNKIIRKEGSVDINLVSVDDLISLKEYANRIQDKQDIYFLSKLKK